MAFVKFLKENEPSTKGSYIPSIVALKISRKKWKIALLISGVFNVLCIGFIVYKFFNN